MALGLSTNQPDRFQGFHARHILVIIDEGLRHQGTSMKPSRACHFRPLPTPPPRQPDTDWWRFYRSHRDPGWKAFHIAAWDAPNFTEFGITEDDLESGTWVDKAPKNPDGSLQLAVSLPHHSGMGGRPALKQWGKEHPAYQARVARPFSHAWGEHRHPPGVDRSRHGTVA